MRGSVILDAGEIELRWMSKWPLSNHSCLVEIQRSRFLHRDPTADMVQNILLVVLALKTNRGFSLNSRHILTYTD